MMAEVFSGKEKEKRSPDAISRRAALDACHDWDYGDEAYPHGDIIEKRLQNLPSVRPDLIRINLNDWVKVKLTDWGKEIYYHQWDGKNQIAGKEIFKPKFPREDENGYTKFQLWHFMELYGEHMWDNINVIEPIELIYVGE